MWTYISFAVCHTRLNSAHVFTPVAFADNMLVLCCTVCAKDFFTPTWRNNGKKSQWMDLDSDGFQWCSKPSMCFDLGKCLKWRIVNWFVVGIRVLITACVGQWGKAVSGKRTRMTRLPASQNLFTHFEYLHRTFTNTICVSRVTLGRVTNLEHLYVSKSVLQLWGLYIIVFEMWIYPCASDSLLSSYCISCHPTCSTHQTVWERHFQNAAAFYSVNCKGGVWSELLALYFIIPRHSRLCWQGSSQTYIQSVEQCVHINTLTLKSVSQSENTV